MVDNSMDPLLDYNNLIRIKWIIRNGRKEFFASLSVTVAENSKIDTKKSAYQSDVLYGTSGDFQADILRTEFLGQDIRGDRGFNIVVVDEVDSMLFDYRSHSVRLSDATPGMIHLELPLAVIWQHINQIVAHFTTVGDQVYFIVEDFERNGDEIKLYSGKNWQSCAMIVDDKRKFIIEQTQSHLEQLLRELSPEERDEYRAYKSLNNQIANLEEEISKTSCDEEKESKKDHCKSLLEKLKTLPWKERYPVLDVPNHLRSIAVSRIPNWTRSALNAAYGYKKGAHYAVQNDRIVPIQYNETGVLQPNMVWSDGLTQFLQLKEGLRMDPEGVSTNFISNVSFFQRYGSAIYGLTGTLGRGTDLKTSESVESHGGMYVAVTFLPKSFRVEMQNVGRTGRSGKKGMGQLIIYNPAKSNIKDIKKDRNAHESAANEKAIQDAEKMLLQDRLFKEFCTLEREYLSGVSMISMRQKWVNLTESYEQYKASEFSPDKITKYVDDMVLKRKKTLVNEVQCKIDSLTDEEKSKLTEDDKQNYYKKAANQAESERSIFKEQHKKLVLDHFFRSQSHQPEELLSCLKDGREFESKFSTFALRYQWGLSDRRGFEECWGLWLKSQNFDENRTSMDEALNRFHNSFGTPFKERAENDELVQNPYYYVLKGNRYLTSGRDTLDQAISCYDRAIAMDPDFSVNARYNKAMTLLSFEENEGPRQRLAYAELKRAKEIIVTIAKPALLSLNVLIGENRERIHTSEHIQHQLNLLSQQENYINKACKVIEEAQSKEYHVKLTANPIIDTFEPDEQHKYNKAIDEATVNGFTHLFTIEVVKPFPWASIIGLALLSLAQMVAGCLLVACTAGAVGTGLIAEGVSDMITVVKSAIEGSFDWAAWAIEKAVGLAISIISCGIKTLSKGLTAVKDGIKAVTNTAKTVINKVTTGEITKQGIKLAAKELGKALAKGFIFAHLQHPNV
uniref:SecA family profile domain-containing protein n=1 Tax=Phlebotomus papatasi TaxID=29031 RepID=A0A1B0DF36_PHLPP